MATASPSMDVGEELQCAICREDLTDPVTLDCGHNFCRGCISRYCETWEGLDLDVECPLCKARIRRGNFRPNWQLANIIDKIKHLPLNPGQEDLCARHKEKLHLFCKEDQELVCLICERSPEHQSHTVLLLEAAAEEIKGQFCRCLEVLRRKRRTILADKEETAKESQDLLSQIEAEKTKTKALFHQLHQLLEEEKALFLAQMEELEEEIEIRREEHMARLLEELSSLEGLIQQMEEKRQQPARELLQDVGGTLQRYKMRETFRIPVAFPPALKWTRWEIGDKNDFLEIVTNQFKDSLASGSQLQKADVTLDPDTAHPKLILSEDCKSVRYGGKCQDLPKNPERFELPGVVLGRNEFTAGRHFWNVDVQGADGWAVGVARKSVRRKGKLTFNPEEGVWTVEKWGNFYLALFSRGLPFPVVYSKRIKVTLNVAARRVAFSDADTGALLYTYSEASFSGETLVPYFGVFGPGCLTLPP